MDGQRALLPTGTGAQTWAAVKELLAQRRWQTAVAFGVLVAATAIGLLTPPLLGHVVDVVVAGPDPAALTQPVVLLVVVAVAQGALTALGVSLVARLGESLLAVVRERFVAGALALPMEQVERAGTGDLTARVTDDVATVGEAVSTALPALARSVLTIVLTLVGLAVLDWRFVLAALLAAPIQYATVRWYLPRAVPLYASQRVAAGAQQQQLLDTVGGAATVRAFGIGTGHVERVTERSWSAARLVLAGARVVTGFYGRLNLAEFVGLGAVLICGFVLVRGDLVTIGAASAAALYFHNLFGPLNIALALVDDAQQAAAGLARLVGLSEAPVRETGAAVPEDASVEVKGVGFAYSQGQDVLSGVDLEIAPGETVALVGASGAGKTTLAKLVAGVHEPDSGTIVLGGIGTAELGPDAVRRTIALITQEVHVFAGPLAEDLRLARPSATDADLRAALERVGALGWVDTLPDGLVTVVGEGGHRLSAAQAQHLALARLVLVDTPVVALDEATAEAGSAGSRVLEAATAQALEGRTSLVVAHRLTQAAAADRIVVMEAGRVVENGTHDELIDAGETYAALWRAWSAPRDDDQGRSAPRDDDQGRSAPRDDDQGRSAPRDGDRAI